MNQRQYLWGLSGGVTAFAIAGFFWYGVGLGELSTHGGWLVFGLSTAFQVVAGVALLVGAVRLRRRTGFVPSELKAVGADQRAENRRITARLGWTILGEGLLIALAVWWCVHIKENDAVFPSIGLIVSLHLLPLARLFRARAYYVTALAGTVVSLIAFSGVTDPHRTAYLGAGLAVVMWGSAAYILLNADQIAANGVARWGSHTEIA